MKVEGPKNYSAVIQVPKNSNLKVRLNGGRLRVNGVEGNKDIESNAGTVSIDVGKPEKYARVDASVDIGHIEAPPYQVIQDGFGRSFAREGPGMYRLHAHVGFRTFICARRPRHLSAACARGQRRNPALLGRELNRRVRVSNRRQQALDAFGEALFRRNQADHHVTLCGEIVEVARMHIDAVLFQ